MIPISLSSFSKGILALYLESFICSIVSVYPILVIRSLLTLMHAFYFPIYPWCFVSLGYIFRWYIPVYGSLESRLEFLIHLIYCSIAQVTRGEFITPPTNVRQQGSSVSLMVEIDFTRALFDRRPGGRLCFPSFSRFSQWRLTGL